MHVVVDVSRRHVAHLLVFVEILKQLLARQVVTATHNCCQSLIVQLDLLRFPAFAAEAKADLRTADLIGDLLIVRLKGVLTVAEQQLVASLPAEKGRDLRKQVRIHLVETARPVMESMIQNVTGTKVVSLHHDISTVTGEEVVRFTLADSPLYRETRK